MSALKIVRVTLVGSLALGALVACSPDNKADPLPTRTAAPSASATTDVRASVEAFVRGYYTAFDRAGQTGELTALQTYFAPSCDACARDFRVLEDLKRKGQRIQAYEVRILKVDVSVAGETASSALITAENAAGAIVDKTGQVVRRLEAIPPFQVAATLRREGMNWIITGLNNLGGVRQ